MYMYEFISRMMRLIQIIELFEERGKLTISDIKTSLGGYITETTIQCDILFLSIAGYPIVPSGTSQKLYKKIKHPRLMVSSNGKLISEE